MVNTSNGDVVEQPFTVRGIFAIQTPAYDDGVVFLPIAKAQAITQAENHASAIYVLLKERDQTDAVAAALKTDNYTIVTWKDANQLMVMLEQYSNSYLVVLYVIVLAITVTVIVNTLVMAVFERTREIGILASMGMKSGRIMAMFFAEIEPSGGGGHHRRLDFRRVDGLLFRDGRSVRWGYGNNRHALQGQDLCLPDDRRFNGSGCPSRLWSSPCWPRCIRPGWRRTWNPSMHYAAENKENIMEVTELKTSLVSIKSARSKPSPARCQPDHRKRRIHCPGRPLRFRQDHPAANDRLSRPAHQR